MFGKKNYFLPFLDNLKAIGLSILFLLFFGSWLVSPVFSAIFTFAMLAALFGLIYSRMWKLSRKNTQRKIGLTAKDFLKFIMPLVIFELVVITFYCLCEAGIVPLDKIILESYYRFPDNAARELVQVSLFDYIGPVIMLWFSYLVGVASKGYVLFIAPLISLAATMSGYYLGSDNKQIQEYYIKATEKAKKKFNE
jgi:hypothetical protein